VKRKRNRILGVDPGTRILGYGVVDCGPRGAFEYVECGVLRAAIDRDMPARLHRIVSELGEIIEEFRPDTLALESAFYGRNAASALKLGQARGAIIMLAGQYEMPVVEYAPATVKQSVVGHGRATKEQIQARVQQLFRLRRAPAVDAADGLAIALTHAFRSPLRVAALAGRR
jgi:crossover junction endodeoxyribonuclease RuvC